MVGDPEHAPPAPVAGELLNRPERARYVLSERGEKVLQEHPDRVDMAVLAQFPEYQEFRTPKSDKHAEEPGSVVADELSPSEAVGQIVEQSYDTLAAELLDRTSPSRPPSSRPCH
ncbi:MAG: hypothetical protein QJR12_09790 [Mycobacterium sp.]|uniref:hypothetical protein n=1 Tax=Mycobacterium sp. TaxID=1785 RepID=UPI00260BC41D|nr:hypothetical protein [Mycobacterium sp.]MDI3314544.1 hypothetical protein [Mycobacterium sp.]